MLNLFGNTGAHSREAAPPAPCAQKQPEPDRPAPDTPDGGKRPAGFRGVRTVIWLVVLIVVFQKLLTVGGAGIEFVFQYANSATRLLRIQAEMESARQVTDNLSATYDRMSEDMMGAIRYLMTYQNAAAAPPEAEDGEEQPAEAAKRSWTLDEVSTFLHMREGGTRLLIVDRRGNILESNISDSSELELLPDFTLEEFEPLFSVFEYDLDFGGPVEFKLENEETMYGIARRYYSIRLDDGRMVVMAVQPTHLAMLQADMESWAHIVGIADCGADTTSFIISAEDDTVIYHPDDNLLGERIRFSFQPFKGIDLGTITTMGVEHDGASMENIRIGFGSLGGRIYVYAMSPEIDGVYIASGIDLEKLSEGNNRLVLGVTALFAVLAALMALYALLLCRVPPEQMKAEKRWQKRMFGKWQDKLLCRRLQGWLALSGVLLLFVTLLSRTLFSLSHYSMNLAGQEEVISPYVDLTRYDQEYLTDMYTTGFFSRCRIVSRLLSEDLESVNERRLNELCETMGIEFITVMDTNGVSIASNAPPSTNEVVSSGRDITDHVLGRLPAGLDYVQYDREEDGYSYTKLIGCRMRGADDRPIGTLLVGFNNAHLQWIDQNLGLDNLLRQMHPGNKGFAFSIDRSTGEFSYYPDENYIGELAAEHGVAESQIDDGYQGFITLGGVSYMAYSIDAAMTDDEIIYLVVPESEISAVRLPYAILAALLGLLLLHRLYRSLTVRRGTGKGKRRQPPADPAPAVLPLLDQGFTVSGLEQPIQKWLALPPGSQLLAVIKGLIMLASLGVSLLAVFGVYLFGTDSTVMYILQRRWQPGLNVFAFTACGILIAVVVTAVALLGVLLDYVCRTLSGRSETLRKLMHSVIRYGATILTLYMALSFLGVDAQAMVASIGVFSLVIGLGAQPLISDIIAGLFVIAEGTYKVGDMITINGYRGTVQEISLRTTKVVGPSDNVMILNNRNISNVINMSDLYSIVTVTLTINYNEDLEQIEALLEENLPKIARRIPDITGGPYYSGVSEIGNNSIKVIIVANCREDRHNYVMRDLNRELIRLFEIDGSGLHGKLKKIDLKAEEPST